MSAGHNDPRLLYSIQNIRAFHLQDGEESALTPSGPQTLSLLMVPTSSPFADLGSAEPQSSNPEEDFYLHLHLPPELDISLPATTQIYHQPPRSYLIPRWDLGPDSGAFTRIEFPSIGLGHSQVTQEDIDTFETILAQCTAFLERATPPKRSEKGQVLHEYNPASFAPGEGYIGHDKKGARPGHIVLIDEENGSVVGELSEGFDVMAGTDVHAGSKRPVEIELPQEGHGNQITVHEVSEEYLRMARHPAYKDSTIVQSAATASRLIVTGSTFLSRSMTSGASNFAQKTKPNPKPLTFSPTTQDRVRKLNNLTHGAVSLSAATVGQINKVAQNFGASMTRRGEAKHRGEKGFDAQGRPINAYKPGLLNKSMMAFSTVADGIEQAGKDLLTSGSVAATTVVGHKYGPDARNIAASVAGGVKNVGLVYVDAAGVSRKAVIKSVAKGMVVGRMPGGGNLMVGSGDGGQVPPEVAQQMERERIQQGGAGGTGAPVSNQDLPGTGQPGVSRPGYGEVGFGNSAPPAYEGGVGEPLGSQGLQGQNSYPYEKR